MKKCEFCEKEYIGKNGKINLLKHLKYCLKNPNSEKYKCEKCGKEFDKRHSLLGHYTYCGKDYKKCDICGVSYVKENHVCIIKNKKTSCKYCGKIFDNGLKLGGHVTRCDLNPNRVETNRKTSESMKNKTLSIETKKKISDSRIKFLIANPNKVPYIVNHSSKMSYPEKLFKNGLEESNINGWIYNFRNGIYQYDFAFPELKIDVEIDGQTHNTEKVKKIDERRDTFSKKDGWIVIRFTSKEVKENLISCINKLKEVIKNKKNGK